MAFVRKRTTKAGSTSTALVEAYRDHNGRSRHRILANLHGEPDALSAIAKLMALHSGLRSEQDAMLKELEEFSEIDRKREWARRLLPRFEQIEATIPRIEREVAAIWKYCSATDEEIETACKAFQKRIGNAAKACLGGLVIHALPMKKLEDNFRRLTALSFKRGQ
jgi:hypothetical protein